MTRKFSSISVNTTLASGISSSATTMTVATGTASALLGGVTLGSAVGGVYPDQFTVAIDPDTSNEEIVFVTFVSSDTLTIVRGRAGSSAITHSGGAAVKHVLTGNDLDYFNTVADNALQKSTLTTKGDTLVATAASTVARVPIGSDGQILVADSTQTNGLKWSTPSAGNPGTLTSVTAGTGLSGGTITSSGTIAIDSTVATLTGSQTLTNKTLTTPTINQAKMYLGYSAKSDNYTVASGDEGYIFSMAAATAKTFSIPTDATFNFPVGTQISFVWITGSGQPLIAATTPATTTILSNAATTASPKLRVQNSAASAIKLSANTWLVVGDLA